MQDKSILEKAYINAYDAFALLESDKLYRGQLPEVLINELNSKRVLCVSDTTDVLTTHVEESSSIARIIERAGLGPQMEVIQSDFIEYGPVAAEDIDDSSPKFGMHLPQNIHETRREYMKVDSTKLDSDLSIVGSADVVLGRNCVCACRDGKLCGGIDSSIENQQNYLQSLVKLKPNLIVLSAAIAQFMSFSDSTIEEIEKIKSDQNLYKIAKSNMQKACENLNQIHDDYKFQLVELDENLTYISHEENIENGYLIVGYDTRKVDFQPTTESLQSQRQEKKREARRNKYIDIKKEHQETQQEKIESDPYNDQVKTIRTYVKPRSFR